MSEYHRTLKSLAFNPNLPIVHHLNSGYLLENGYYRHSVEMEKGKQSILITYKKGDSIVTYNGVEWVYNGRVVQFVEDLTNNPTSEE